MRIRRLAFVAAVLVLGAGAWAMTGLRPTPVPTVAVKTGTAAELVYASGTVEPKTWAKVASLVRARIVETCSCEGRPVAAGTLLVRLDDSEVRATVKAEEARRVLARQELDRASELLTRSVGSRQSFERAASGLDQIEASLAALVEKQNEFLVTAPIAGQVLRLDASVGEIAEAGGALAWVGLPRPLEVVSEVNEEDIPRVAVGQSVLLRSDAFPGRALAATVGSITPKGDPIAKTYRVRLALPDDTPLFIGMTVDANIVIRRLENRVIVPVAALHGAAVPVIADGRLAMRPVTVGIRGLEAAEITGGLAAGDTIVMPLPEGVSEGDRVKAAAP